MQSNLPGSLEALAQTPRLLVACDYDGTLAELVVDPTQAFPAKQALKAFRSFSEMEDTTIAVVSGRSLSVLDGFLGIGAPEIRIGSHGAEWASPGVSLTTTQRSLLAQVASAVTSFVEERLILRCELKPAGVALHFRGVNPRLAEMTVAAAVASFGSLPGVYVRCGSEVVEFMVVPANKGDAVLRLKQATGASAVLFIGDDLTDEDVFKVLTADDEGVRVGDGDTHAGHRVASVTEVAAVLEAVCRRRHSWIQNRAAAQ